MVMIHADRQIPGWFPEICRNHLIWLMRKHDVKVVLEVGAFLGKSTIFFAERCQRVYSVDHFKLDCLTSEDEKKFSMELGLPNHFFHIWEDNLKQAKLHHPGLSFATLTPLFPGLAISIGPAAPPEVSLECAPDLVYIDGSHQYPAVVSDIEKYGFLALKIICGDDYGVAEGVTMAVDDLRSARKKKGRAPVETAGPFWWTEVKTE